MPRANTSSTSSGRAPTASRKSSRPATSTATRCSGRTAASIPGNDLLASVVLKSGDNAINYNFCELLPVSIAGRVFADTNGNCEFDEGEQGIAGVTIQLLDDRRQRRRHAPDRRQGDYKFDELPPGTYTVREVQPAGLLRRRRIGRLARRRRFGQTTWSPTSPALGRQCHRLRLLRNAAGQPLGLCLPRRRGDRHARRHAAGQSLRNSRRQAHARRPAARRRGAGAAAHADRRAGPGRGAAAGHVSARPGARRRPTPTATTNSTACRRATTRSSKSIPKGFFDSIDTPGTTNGLAVNVGTTGQPAARADASPRRA